MKWTPSSSWHEHISNPALGIALATFAILALELALIRWMSSQIRIFSYFNNVVLIMAFLGLGAGIPLGKKHPKIAAFTLPLLLLLAIPVAFSKDIGLVRMPFPDQSVSLWGAENFGGSALVYLRSLSIFLLLLTLISSVFVCAGAYLGALFQRLPPLRAYSWDLIGSLLGVIAMAITTALYTGPAVWFALAVIPLVYLSRSISTILCGICLCALAFYSHGDAVFSPYNRIELNLKGAPNTIGLSVNRDFHQIMHNLSDEALNQGVYPERLEKMKKRYREVYDLPFLLNRTRRSVVIVGAGTGNDVQAALRAQYGSIYSVDIDPQIIELGRKLHPEHPYSDPRVVRVVDDARAFFERAKGERFDLVNYGLLDSHAMFSSMSSLRLENYVYTEEGIRAGWELVSPQGHLAINFSVFAGQWIMDRLYWTIKKATGKEPLVVFHDMHRGATFVVEKSPGNIDPTLLLRFERLMPVQSENNVITTSDDWPFLYFRPLIFPYGYAIVLVFVLMLGSFWTIKAYGLKALRSGFDLPLFLMGAAFLLLETRGITSVSLLFGSTWNVNTAIFGAVLLAVIVGNGMVRRFNIRNAGPWFVVLFGAVLLVAFFDNSLVHGWPLIIRGILGSVINVIPIGIAGIIVPILLLRANDPVAGLGSYLLGSVVGGCLEYFSIFMGLQYLAFMALFFYACAYLVFRRTPAQVSS
jgi:SAM-dependent methyltransferase